MQIKYKKNHTHNPIKTILKYAFTRFLTNTILALGMKILKIYLEKTLMPTKMLLLTKSWSVRV